MLETGKFKMKVLAHSILARPSPHERCQRERRWGFSSSLAEGQESLYPFKEEVSTVVLTYSWEILALTQTPPTQPLIALELCLQQTNCKGACREGIASMLLGFQKPVPQALASVATLHTLIFLCGLNGKCAPCVSALSLWLVACLGKL